MRQTHRPTLMIAIRHMPVAQAFYTDAMETVKNSPPLSRPGSLDYCAVVDAAVSAAHAGAAILQSYAHNRSVLVVDRKARNDLVSQADREAETAIVGILRERTPSFGIIGEEGGGQLGTQATWYIDPLDGTTNFLHGIPHYAVSIALIAHAGSRLVSGTELDRDTPVIGVVYDPCREELFTGALGIGTWLNGRRVQCSRTHTIEDAVVATGFPFRDFSYADQYMPMLHDAINTAQGVRRHGAAALDLAWTAAGRFDGYWEMGLAPWDVAAGTLLVREAGGIAEDMHGKDSWPIGGRVVSGNVHVGRALQAIIARHLKD